MKPEVRRKLTAFLFVCIIMGGVLVYAETLSPTLLDFPNGTLNIGTIDTGQGAGELYGMDQDIKTSDGVTFATVDTGQGANELYDMDQNVLTSSDVTLNSLTCVDVIDTNNIKISSVTLTDVLKYPYSSADYIIESDGTTIRAKNCTTGLIDYSGADGIAILQTIIDVMPSKGWNIFLKPPFRGNAQLEIDKSNVSIYSNKIIRDQTDEPYIQQIIVNATLNDIENIFIQGIATREIHYFSHGHYIQRVKVQDSDIAKTASYRGLLYEGDGTTAGYINEIFHEFCRIRNTAGNDGDTWGSVTYTNVEDVTDTYYDYCDFSTYKNTQTVFYVNGSADVARIAVNFPRWYHDTGTTDIRFIYQAPRVGSIQGQMHINIQGGGFELHKGVTILHIPQSTNALKTNFKMSGVMIGVPNSGQGTVYGFNVTNTNWNQFAKSWIMFEDNQITTNTGVFEVGPLPDSEIDVLEIFVSGNAGLEDSLGSETYRIRWDGTNYYASNSNDVRAFTSSSGSTILQKAIDTKDNGTIYLDLRVINFTASSNITGNGDRANPIGGWEIYGRGQYATTINQAQNHNAFKLNDGAILHIHDLEIIIPSTNAKTAIFGSDDGANIKNSVLYFKIGNINIEGGGGTDCYAVHLIAPSRWNKYGVTRTQMNGGAGSWKFENTDNLNWGDGTIDGYHQNILNANDLTGYSFIGTSSGSIGPIKGSGFVYVSEWGTRTGLKAVKAEYWSSSELYIHAEHMDDFLDLYECDSTIVRGPFVSMDSAGTLFNITSGWDMEIGPFPSITVANQTTIFYDDTATERGTTFYHDMTIKMGSGTPVIGTYQTETKFSNVEINQLYSENAGRTAITNGNTEVTITHYLWATPKKAFIQGLTYEEVDRARPSNIGATTFKVKVPAAVSQTSYVDWYVSVNTGWIP